MNILDRHLQTARQFMAQYDGETPFHLYLKNCFRNDKKYGSKDRKNITQVCYTVFRTGKSLQPIDFTGQFVIAHYLLNDSPGVWGYLYKDDWISNWSIDLPNRISFIKEQFEWFDITAIFPFGPLSDLLEHKPDFVLGHLTQPDVFIRIRPGYESFVNGMLSESKIVHRKINENCIAITPPVDLENINGLNKAFVVQDYASQQTGIFMDALVDRFLDKPAIKVWDCCAASGGKSIMAYDLLQKADITVSDIRSNILQNLNTRFLQAGIHATKSFIADLSKPLTKDILPYKLYDLIICDAPCTGSGTWSRTPERLRYFNPGSIDQYARLQQAIVSNVLPFLAKDGYLLYITCSVFKQENEAVVLALAKQHHLSILEMKSIAGTAYRADTMFACLLQQSG